MFGRGSADAHRQHRRLQPAADHRPVDQRRLRIPARGPGGPGPGASWAASCRGWSPPPTRTRGSAACSRPSPRPTRRSISTSTATRRRRSGSTINDVFSALQSTLGGLYVNDFNLFGRTWQVNIQGEAAGPRRHRRHLADPGAQQAGRDGAAALDRRAALRPRAAGRSSATTTTARVTINGAPAPGVRPGDALAAMEEVRPETLPPGYALRMDRHRLSGIRRRRARPAPSWRSPCSSPTCSWSRCTRAGSSRCRCCCRSSVGVLGAYRRHPDRRPDARPLCADRPGRADRARRQERHPDRRVRQGAARARAADPATPPSSARACGSAR